MSQSRRKAIGVILTLVSIVMWSIVAIWLYEALGIGGNTLLTLVYFVIAGVGWVFPAMAIISWMSRPDAPSRPH